MTFMNDSPAQEAQCELQSLSNSSEFNYYVLPRSPIQGELKGALRDCGIDLFEWGAHGSARNTV